MARKHLRGSTLLLSGRTLSIGVKLVIQTLIVRYLTTADYGAWAYGLAIVAFLGGFSSLSLKRSLSRFLAIYHQRRDYDHFLGAMVLTMATILVTGVVFALAVYAFPELITRLAGGEAQPTTLLLILVFLVPLEALDQVLIAIFATFNRARAIFVRRYILAPVLKLAVVLLLIGLDVGVVFLAYGYLIATLIGVIVYGGLLIRLLHQQGVLSRTLERHVRVPLRELVSFTIPLMTSDWLASLVGTSGVLLLGYYYTTNEIALFKAIVPIAVLNELVIRSFKLLYTPNASRLFADGNLRAINDLYWSSAVWIAVLSFPLFALTFTAATPLAVLFFGERYAASGGLLAVLTVGYYIQAALGFNGDTLKVMGRLRSLVTINLAALAVNVILAVLLVPRFGPMGAAVTLTGTLILHNVFKQTGLRMAAGISIVDPRYMLCYGTIVAAATGLVVVRTLAPDSFLIQVAAAVLGSVAVLLLTKKTLRIGDTFPEIHRVPVLRVVFA